MTDIYLKEKPIDKCNNLTELSEYQLQELFLETIRQEADKADLQNRKNHIKFLLIILDVMKMEQELNMDLEVYKDDDEYFINLENLVIRSNNPYRRWIELYDFCKSKELTRQEYTDTTDKYLLPNLMIIFMIFINILHRLTWLTQF